jgi:hypothetical protein
VSGDFAEFRVDLRELDRPRPPGISAFMRIRDGQDFLRLSIESHLRYFDEIVACHNGCRDRTPHILAELAAQYPGKVRPVEYLPPVHTFRSPEHDRAPTESVHAFANYSNYALVQARYSYAVKLDDDHLALDAHLPLAVAQVRASAQAGRRELFTFSGLNLAPNASGNIGVYATEPFVGVGDHLFFPVCTQVHFIQAPGVEAYRFAPPRLPKRYAGLLYAHLKHLKPEAGYACLDEASKSQWQRRYAEQFAWLSLAEFASVANLRRLRAEVNPLEYWLRTTIWTERIIHALSGRNPPLKIARLARLESDLAAIDFQGDVLARLRDASF